MEIFLIFKKNICMYSMCHKVLNEKYPKPI